MNARKEFIDFIKGKPRVIAAELEDVYYSSDTKGKTWTLYPSYYEDDYKKFLKSIDFDYSDGYGSQELGGTIWFEDGTFADRGEYDGSEWWEYHKAPPLPTPTKESEPTDE